MASFKHNVLKVRELPSLQYAIDKLNEAKQHQLPQDQTSIIDVESSNDKMWVTLLCHNQTSVNQYNAAIKTMQSISTSKDIEVKFSLFLIDAVNHVGCIEVYTGGASVVDIVQKFVAGILDGDSPVMIDIMGIDDLMTMHPKLEGIVGSSHTAIKGATIAKYKYDEEVVGSYSPKFATTLDAISFVTQLGPMDEPKETKMKNITLAWRNGTSRISVKITPDCCFTISAPADQEDHARSVVRRLVGIAGASPVGVDTSSAVS